MHVPLFPHPLSTTRLPPHLSFFLPGFHTDLPTPDHTLPLCLTHAVAIPRPYVCISNVQQLYYNMLSRSCAHCGNSHARIPLTVNPLPAQSMRFPPTMSTPPYSFLQHTTSPPVGTATATASCAHTSLTHLPFPHCPPPPTCLFPSPTCPPAPKRAALRCPAGGARSVGWRGPGPAAPRVREHAARAFGAAAGRATSGRKPARRRHRL
mmetsp:Transcript_10055/g.30335  ORF Transcript_10055/g.30335 Transcript_10055/m.30335 type:complete len:208 (-) Transcript_10055:221-844(-)